MLKTDDERRRLQRRFIQDLAARLDRGAEEYGDRSFGRQPQHVFDEILDEVLDVAGWAFVAWVHMRERLEALLDRFERATDERRRVDDEPG